MAPFVCSLNEPRSKNEQYGCTKIGQRVSSSTDQVPLVAAKPSSLEFVAEEYFLQVFPALSEG